MLATIAESMTAPLKKPPTRPVSAIRSQMLRRVIHPKTIPRVKARMMHSQVPQVVSIQPNAAVNEQVTPMVKIATNEAARTGKRLTPQRAITKPKTKSTIPKSHKLSSIQFSYFS